MYYVVQILWTSLNDTQRERLVFHSIQYRNGWLAASNFFDMFTQSIKINFYSTQFDVYMLHFYQYRCLKNVDNKKGWLLLSVLRQSLG